MTSHNLIIIVQIFLFIYKMSGHEILTGSSCAEDECESTLPDLYVENTTEHLNNVNLQIARKVDSMRGGINGTVNVIDKKVESKNDIKETEASVNSNWGTTLKEEYINPTETSLIQGGAETTFELIKNSEHKIQEVLVNKTSNELDNNGDNNVSNETFFSNAGLMGTTTEITLLPTKGINSSSGNATHINLLPPDKAGNISKINAFRRYSDICTCDLRVNECDVNCCCDEDCTSSMKQVFSSCIDAADLPDSIDCHSSPLLFMNNAKNKKVESENRLFCVVRNNLNHQLKFQGGQIIENVTTFKKNIMRRKLFSFSQKKMDDIGLQRTAYKMGDIIWSVEGKYLKPFGTINSNVNMFCKSTRNIHYLLQYSATCIQSVPDNAKACEQSESLGMNYYLRNAKIIKSPDLIKSSSRLEAEKICSNGTCISINPYICSEGSEISACAKASPKSPVWDSDICRNIVKTVEYYFYHNGTKGIKKVRAYFFLKDIPKSDALQFTQSVKVKFLWMTSMETSFVRSGNPGYLMGRPVMAGRKVYYNNETVSLKKEAIELPLSSSHWLSVFSSANGLCSSVQRHPINFGENLHISCSIPTENYDILKRKCVDLQDNIFEVLLGDDVADIRDNGFYNKFVATFGNSKLEDTNAWVHVIFDALPIISSQVTFTSYVNSFICKNIITDLFIDIAYSKVGSFERPQAKIIGVHFHFGPPLELIHHNSANRSVNKFGRQLKISTFVHFIDVTNKATEEFAETPGFEAKLPHDFFYPFFSESCTRTRPDRIVIFVMFHLPILFELV